MHTIMDLELVNYINEDLKWNMVKKGRRSMTRRPRKPGADAFKLGVELSNKIQDPAYFETKKSGMDVLGQRFAEKVVDAPLKKRRLLHQSPSPPSQIPCLNGKGALSPEHQTPSFHREDSDQRCRSNSLSKSQETRSKTGLRNGNILKPTKTEVSNLDDFSGIELLAAAACSTFTHNSADHVEEFAVLKEHTTPGISSCTVDIIEAIMPTESDDSSVQESMVPDTQNLHDNGNEGGEKGVAPSKGFRLHWDLNTVMDDWEEPCDHLLAEPHAHENCSEGVHNGGLKSVKLDLEGYESRCSDVVGAEERSVLDSVYRNQLSGKHDAAISVVPLIENCNGDSYGKTYELIEDLCCSWEVMGTKTITSKTSDGESVSKSDLDDSLIHPSKSEDFSTSTTSVLREQTIVKGESETIDDPPVHPKPKNTMSKSDRQPASEEVMQGGCQSPKLCRGYTDNKATSEDPLSDCCGSNVTQDEQGHMAEGDTMDKVQAGYDSPFEDGELREPIGWEENEVEGRDCVYYESDNVYKDDLGAIENLLSEKFEVSHEHGQSAEDRSSLLVKEVKEKFHKVGNRRLGAVPDNDIEQDAQADTFKRPQSLLGSKGSGCQPNIEENHGSENVSPQRKNGHGESRKLGGNLLLDGSSFDVCRNGAYVERNRSSNIGDSYSRAGRDLGPENFMERDKVSFQGCSHNGSSGPWVDSSTRVWDLKSSHEYLRPKNVTGDPVARPGGSRILDSNQSRNYNQSGTYRTLNRKPSPSQRNDGYGIHRGPPVRSLSRDRCRGGSEILPQGLRRAPEGEYHDLEPCYLERKVRCFSPNFNRPVRRSQSRSRSGSPIAWHFQKRRKLDTRQSPDQEARFQGERHPFRKPSFSGDVEAGFVSLTRARVSPERSSKCFDDRKFIDGQFRDKKPFPVTIIRRNQRFEPTGYPERLKSDDHFRFTRRPGRFTQMTGPGRDYEYKDNGDDIRKPDDRYGKVNRVGRSDDAGGVRQFRYAVDDSFETRSHRNLDSFSRDARNKHSSFRDAAGTGVPESTSEEKCPSSVSRFPHA